MDDADIASPVACLVSESFEIIVILVCFSDFLSLYWKDAGVVVENSIYHSLVSLF